ncbi:glutathione S-transferase family protein [Rhizorhabdus sp. FW153]|uniref:glutathione S-transferase family protein n=1 Tax=Rhizorhabdus sp. FW153 TaxID=3400216 RepID=UPI003CE9B92E
MYKLFIGNKNYSSWSLRPWILMRQLGIAFEEILVPFGDGAFDAFSPTGKVPCLMDGTLVIWDSLAIAEYLAEQNAAVWPADREARAWARSAAAEMHSGFSALREVCTMNCGIRVQLKEQPSALDRDITRIASLWSEGLSRFGGPWLAGADFSAVDAFFAPVAFRFQTYGITLDERCDGYARRLLELPHMEAWYAAALSEPYRDVPHEEEALRAGAIVQDFRKCSGEANA